jgi:uncharacterized protein YbjQ (UPF0145 family)
MAVTTGLSGNEIYCLAKKGYTPGNIVVGNSVHSLGLLRSIGTGFKTLLGGELEQMTALISEGRETAFKRLVAEGNTHQATGITGVTSELIFHGTNIEFLALGSTIHGKNHAASELFTSNSDGQELYAQLDAGYKPICFAFGNVVYSMGVARGIWGNLKMLARGEIKEFSDIFNHTRHLALERIIQHAKDHNANAVLGIRTTILSFSGVNEMLMIGTASHNPNLPSDLSANVITSDMTNIEMWNMASLGYVPMRLLLGTSVYSLGLAGRITSTLKSFVRGEINELTQLIYEARENALGIINKEAQAIGADDVVGVKTYVYQLGNGLIEFLAIGTAVKKVANIQLESEQLPPQALVVDKDTFYDSSNPNTLNVNVNSAAKPMPSSSSMLSILFGVAFIIFIALVQFMKN